MLFSLIFFENIRPAAVNHVVVVGSSWEVQVTMTIFIKRAFFVAALAAWLSFGFGTAASATILLDTITGTISSGYDQTGVFGVAGQDLAGHSYVVKYRFDSTLGHYSNCCNVDRVDGGLYIGYSPSPVDKYLTIDGVSQYISGVFAGNMLVSSFYDYVALKAQSNPTSPPAFPLMVVYSEFHGTGLAQVTDTLPLTNLITYGTFLIQDANQYAAGNFGTQGTAMISVVPEPATWATMLMGLCGLGLALRARRQQVAATA